ncbi:MAG: HEAT repeat domain-containing protein [Candidatus Riflebacteria bacterium]|nr:HEAT repeat domain-containing protein [Candidatus Riflebacteria bacterium]
MKTSFLETANSSDIAKYLQNLFVQEDLVDETILEKIEELKNHADLGIRFWARRVCNKISTARSKTTIPEASQETTGINDSLVILQKKLVAVQEETFLAIAVIQQILEKKDPQSVPFLSAHLKNTKDAFQISYLTKHLCIWFPSDDLLTVILPFLHHSDDRVVANTVEGIERLKTEKGIPYFSQMLRHPNHRVRAKAAKALSQFNKEKTFQALQRMLRLRDEPHYVIAACYAVCELKDPRFLPILSENLGYRLLFDETLTALRAIDSEETNRIILQRKDDFHYFESKLQNDLFQEAAKDPRNQAVRIVKILIVALIVMLAAGYYFFPTPARVARNKLSEMGIPFQSMSLTKAIQNNDIIASQLLLTAGINPLGAGDDGTPFFHLASILGNKEIYDVLTRELKERQHLLSRGEIVKQISEIKNSSGENILHVAVKNGQTNFLRFLKENNFDFSNKDAGGNTLLHTAVLADQEKSLVFLLSQQLPVNEKNFSGNTPLHEAVLEKKKKMIYWLMKLGNADPNLSNLSNMTPIDLGLGKLYSDE